MAWKKRSSKAEDGKYLRLTGLWQNKKKDNLFTGKMKAEDVQKLFEKCDEAVNDNSDLVFFLWVNNQEKRNDPEFTLQVSISEGEVGSGRKSYGRGRDRDDRDDREETRDRKRDSHKEREEQDNGSEEDQQEDKEEARSSRTSKRKEPVGKEKKSDKDDW